MLTVVRVLFADPWPEALLAELLTVIIRFENTSSYASCHAFESDHDFR